ncbi:MAG TPA: hypothetical protein VJU84_04995 [Pyrinomonadaceae bacterium]|nr:hypothetical protein [Pyrinomonadaceae bacterium]
MKYIAPQKFASPKSRALTSRIGLAVAVTALLAFATTSAFMAPPMSGAIFTTDSTCGGTNINIFANKDAVYLDGGPAHVGAAGLPDGEYYVMVTTPGGALLGTSIGSADETPVTVTGGEFAACYQLSAIVIKASDATAGYDDTSNPGGEYKVWVSSVNTFDNDASKTDNFKVKCPEGSDCGTVQPPQGTINVLKFYDANANGLNDDGQPINGWKVRIQDNIDYTRFTPASVVVDAPDTYTVTESTPLESNWFRTTPNPVIFLLAENGIQNVEFGNLCRGAGGGLTLGFWSNKNGGNTITSKGLLPGVLALCLRTGDGSLLGSVNLGNFQKFLLNASATNMANMLSAQTAAMHLNVASGGVNANAIVYAPGTDSANSLGYAKISDLLNEANTILCTGGATKLVILTGNPLRPRAEAVKTALDNANNNLSFVQATPCPFSFPQN